MTVQQFQQLSLEKRIELINRLVCTGEQEELLATVYTYQWEDLTIEVHWRKPQHYIFRIEAYKTPSAGMRNIEPLG